jgi:hypothetical protein
MSGIVGIHFKERPITGPKYRGKFDTDMIVRPEEIEAGLFELPVYRVPAEYMTGFPEYNPLNPFVGYESDKGIYLIDGLAPVQYRVAHVHEVIGNRLRAKGKAHDDPTIAAIEARYFLRKNDREAFLATVNGARDEGWVSEKTYESLMSRFEKKFNSETAYGAGYIER